MTVDDWLKIDQQFSEMRDTVADLKSRIEDLTATVQTQLAARDKNIADLTAEKAAAEAAMDKAEQALTPAPAKPCGPTGS